MMENFYIERMASHIGLLMQKSLLYEVNATLKPGLVDRAHNGAHQDMSLITFADSAYIDKRYIEMASNVIVMPDDYVEAGHVLGYIGEPTKYFSVEGSNLYFELQKDGTPIDPIDFFE